MRTLCSGIVGLLTCVLLAACGGSQRAASPTFTASTPHVSAPGQSASPGPSGAVAADPVGEPLNLPAPAELLDMLPPEDAHGASFVAADLIREAEDFEQGLPNQHIAQTIDGLQFFPEFAEGTAEFSGLSFAMYRFSIPDYDGNPLLLYEWISAPADPGNAYFGFANLDLNRWEWFRASASGRLTVPSLDPFFAGGQTLLMTVVLIGNQPSELDRLLIGGIPPQAFLGASPLFGAVPLSVTFDASASSDADGEIVQYRWDPEGDGSFDLSTGQNPILDFDYLTGGTFNAAVRVIDDAGLHVDDAVSISAIATTSFTIGSPGAYEFPGRLLACPDGDLLYFGTNATSDFSFTHGMVARFNSDGVLKFAKLWSLTSHELLRDAVMVGDTVYVCGSTETGGVAGQEGLLQKWTLDGELVWSRTLGQADSNEQFDAIDIHSDAIYVCGTMDPENLPLLTLTAGLDLEGNRVWSRTMIAPERAALYDVMYRPAADSDPAICVCGDFYSASDFDLLYAEYSESGLRQACMIWEGTASDSAGYALSAVDDPSVSTFIAGTGSGFGLLGKPGGAMVQLTHGSGFSLLASDLLGQQLLLTAGDTAGIDFRSEAALVNFDSDLGILSQASVFSSPTGSFTPAALFSYGPGGVGILGSSELGVPLEVTRTITASAASGVWTAITPSQGQPPFTKADTSISLIDLDDLALNRQAADDDIGIHISSF